MNSNSIVFLSKASKLSVASIGGKASPLSKLIMKNISIPEGFVIKTMLFEKILKENGLDREINSILNKAKGKKGDYLNQTSEKIRKLIEKVSIPDDVSLEILDMFSKLGSLQVSVRSSATCEDLKELSWAGEFDSFTFVDKKNLISMIKRCWSSSYTARALAYAIKNNYPLKRSMAVIVQKMIQSYCSGVCFTLDPVSNDDNVILIEAIYGTGELLVHGDVSPDKYWIEKDSETILDVDISIQTKKIIQNNFNKVGVEKIEKNKRNIQKLSGKQIIDLAKVCKKIEKIMGSPQDVEWAMQDGKLFILQSRPITALYKRCKH